MNTNKKRIEGAIEQVMKKAVAWIKPIEGVPHFVDPIDGKEISAHYGATHMAASMILWGINQQDQELRMKGQTLLVGILDRWDVCMNLPAFHYDFNNFALCLIYDALDSIDDGLKSRISEAVLKTPDSNHPTVNWLPMRMIVNQYRYKWTGKEEFMIKAEDCASQIRLATNPDGGIEDRLPKGVSFNLQYDLATVGVLQYAIAHGWKGSLEKEMGFLLNVVSPDGDINYQGRGTNQIFAWGLWVYLLSSSGQEKELTSAMNYLESRLGVMLEKNNMMLNEWDGNEKYLWWDYHYASVYTAHLLLWLVLAHQDYGKQLIELFIPERCDTGLHVYRSDLFFVCWFDGRNEYLPEKGPAVSCVWSKSYGVVCKGAFAPWHGAFGNYYSFDNVALQNYCGLIEIRNNRDISQNRVIRKLFPSVSLKKIWLRESPAFCPIIVAETEGKLTITWNYEGKEPVVLNVPSIPDALRCEVVADEVPQQLMRIGKIRNQYGWVNVLQTRPIKTTKITLILF